MFVNITMNLAFFIIKDTIILYILYNFFSFAVLCGYCEFLLRSSGTVFVAICNVAQHAVFWKENKIIQI